MKIAYFLDLGFGGAGNLLLQRAALMSKLHDVIVVIPIETDGKYNNEYVIRCERYGIAYTCLKYSTSTNFHFINFSEAMLSVTCIEEFTKKEKITFFHSVQLNLAVEYISRKLQIPHLIDIYQLCQEEFQLCPGNIYPRYHLCDSLLYANRWSSQLEMESRCIRPVAISDCIRKKIAYSHNGIKILMLGVVCIRKNQMAAIKAVEQCSGSYKVELHIAGNDTLDYAKECKKYVKEHGLERFVRFHGLVSEIVPLLEYNDCLLCSSTDESFPSAIVEALTYDLTIISTPVAGVPELFVNRVNSFISKDFSVKSIRESIQECIVYHQSGEIDKIHRNAEKTWGDNFERKIVRKQIEEYYNDIINNYFFESNASFFIIEREVEEIKKLLCDMDNNEKKWICRKCLYYTVVRKRLSGGKVYIWGAGNMGKVAFEILTRICSDLTVIAFADMHKEGTYCGIPVIKVEDMTIEKYIFYCVSFVKDKDEAIQYLENKGLALNAQIWVMP